MHARNLKLSQIQMAATHQHRFLLNLRQPEPPVMNWRILLVQSFTARMPLLMVTSAFGLGRRRWSSPQQCYLYRVSVGCQMAARMVHNLLSLLFRQTVAYIN